MANEHVIKAGATNPPDTFVRSTHSLRIVAAGQTVGLINGWNPQQNRAITPIYEIDPETSGLPIENVPGNVQNLTIAVQRYDVWPSRMEQAFGTPDLTMLSRQQSPFEVYEEWKNPNGSTEVWKYNGCWFENIGRSFRSDDTRIVNVNATLRYLHRFKIEG